MPRSPARSTDSGRIPRRALPVRTGVARRPARPPVAAPRADEILRKYESDLSINKITTAVVDQLRGNLIARSRVAHIIEIAINVSSLIVGLLIGAWLIFAEPEKNPVQTTFVLWAVLAIAGLQLFGNLFLRYFDKNR